MDALATSLERSLDLLAAAHPNPGRPVAHRLNRTEFANAVRDLLALDVDLQSQLPADVSAYGFDNVADLLSSSPALTERYLSVAKLVSRLAVGDARVRPVVEVYSAPKDLLQDERVSEDLPFGSRGGLAVRHYFPVDGEYVLRVRLRGPLRTARVSGLSIPTELDVRLDGVRLKLFALRRDPASRSPASRDDSHSMPEVRVPVKAGSRLIGVTFPGQTLVPEGVHPAHLPVGVYLDGGFTDYSAKYPAVESIEVTGPYGAKAPEDTPSRRRIFVCRPTRPQDEGPCARRVIAMLARRAYRRPVTEADIRPLVGFFQAERPVGDFDTAIQAALERILIDPEFLFRIERHPSNALPGAAFQLGDVDLASRLSFFLWSSIPDDELLRLAERGVLNRPDVLEQQVRRMLQDARAAALIDSFAVQWLYLRNVQAARPDLTAAPEFDANLRAAFQRETTLYLESQFRDDRPVIELLSADYTFLNERLARHYGIDGVYGDHFRRVTLSDERRRGLLGQASILTATSPATRTSPVLRGKWVLENILGTPVPPPPPNVPALKENDEGSVPTSVRERLEAHRRNPVCASCHVQMDPIGFALENFDSVGKWRDTAESGAAIDASATLTDGTKLDGPVELRSILLRRQNQFVKTFVEKLTTYALGRGLEWYDEPAIRAIVASGAQSDSRWSAIIIGISRSIPFRMSRLPPNER